MCQILENLWKSFFIGKYSNFNFQNWGYFEKNNLDSQLVAGTFFREKNVLWFFFKFTEMKFRVNKCAKIWKISKKLFLTGNKSNFKFQNRGYFREKNIPQICWNFVHNKIVIIKFAEFWKICEKLFFTGKKSNFKFQNRGYFRKKMFRKIYQTSVIISL